EGRSRIKIMVVAGTLIIVASIVLEWMAGWGYLGIIVPSGTILGIGILIGSVLICCTSTMLTSSYAARMPGYGDMEIRFKEGERLFDEEEWVEALVIFRELMGPQMNHKRALYYAARCSEKMDDWEAVKAYCKQYIKMQPRDKEVWEMKSKAHKKLFEYEEAEDAMLRAENL
ncbi:MAG: tetratricopeptide repeat protein, partial [Candidatus Thorarchaeota archaeon]|nr:tetratricopeptide repeat protein [Candidatus Thorarchaeota archaeon]